MEIKEYNPVIYPYRLWLCLADEPSDMPKKFYEEDGGKMKNIVEDTKSLEAFTIPVMTKGKNGKYGVAIFFRSRKSMTYELVAHECSHAAKYLFEFIEADMQAHEPFEFVIGWMAGCCEEFKNKDNHGKQKNISKGDNTAP